MPSTTVDAFWERQDPRSQRIARFGDRCLVFNSVSWETHLASGHVADVLEVIGERRVSSVELERALLGADSTAEEARELSKLLAGLEKLDLIKVS
jgi:PqqD family protein of HPr-rel-A system